MNSKAGELAAFSSALNHYRDFVEKNPADSDLLQLILGMGYRLVVKPKSMARLNGGPLDGRGVFCDAGSSVLSVVCCSGSWAAYVKRPDGDFQYATVEAAPTGEEVE